MEKSISETQKANEIAQEISGNSIIRWVWRSSCNFASNFCVKYKVIGDWEKVYRENPRLLIISNHASHLDATSISGTIPYKMWKSLFIAAAKDYFFKNKKMAFFSKHCLSAIPIDRKDDKKKSVETVKTMLKGLDRIWIILFPEGTRSKDGKINRFKKGVSIFSQETNTPILFVYLKGNAELWPKGASYPTPGLVTVEIGPVQPPAPIEVVEANYKKWVLSIDPTADIVFPEFTEQRPVVAAPAN